MEQKGSFVWLVLLGMCAATVAAGLFIVDPLGIGSASEYEAQRIFQRLHASWYGYTSPAQNKISVVLIDDAYVDSTGHAWPIPYRYQAALLRKILSHNPKAVFVDLLYRKEHNDAESPRELIESIRRKDVPIVLTALADKSLEADTGNCIVEQPIGVQRLIDADSLHTSLYDLRTRRPHANFPQLQVAYVGWYGCGERYPLYLGGNPEVPTPAFAMYRMLREGKSMNVAEFRTPLTVVWGSIQSSQSMKVHTDETNCIDQPSRLGYFGSQLRAALVRGGGLPRQPCPYTDYLLASQLMASGTALDSSAEGQLTADKWLTGRTVLMGLAVTGIPDVVSSPVHGQVPGVFLHAMALDNLLTYDEGYTRAPSWMASVAAQVTIIFLIALFYSRSRYSRWTSFAHRWHAARGSSRRPSLSAALEFLLWLALTGLLLKYARSERSWDLLLGAGACIISCIGFDLMRKRFLLRIIGSGALALLICLLLWWLFDIDPFNWIALAAMIASAREAIIKAHQRMYKLKDDAEPSSLLIDSGLVPADLFGRSRA